MVLTINNFLKVNRRAVYEGLAGTPPETSSMFPPKDKITCMYFQPFYEISYNYLQLLLEIPDSAYFPATSGLVSI